MLTAFDDTWSAAASVCVALRPDRVMVVPAKSRVKVVNDSVMLLIAPMLLFV